LKKDLLKVGWKQKIIRLRPDYIKLCTYLEFHAEKLQQDRYTFFDNLFKYSIEQIQEKGIIYAIEVYEPLRTGKGFLLSEKVTDEFEDTYKFVSNYYMKKLNKKLLVAEFTELLLYIYVMDRCTEDELRLIDFDFGIKKK